MRVRVGEAWFRLPAIHGGIGVGEVGRRLDEEEGKEAKLVGMISDLEGSKYIWRVKRLIESVLEAEKKQSTK